MKNIFFICIFGLLAFTGCTDDEEDLIFEGDGTISYPQQKPNSIINEKLFEVINLDYPGLEKVKAHYEAGNLYYAAEALLKYYQTRTDAPVNPNLNLMNITITNDDQMKADQALNYRFYVKGFTNASDGLPYQVSKKDGKLNWENRPNNTSDEYPKQLHRHQWFVSQAKAYRYLNDEKYINSWIEVYGDWISQNPKPTEEVKDILPWWQLQTASRLADQVELFEYYKNSVNFTPEWLSVFLTSFADHCDYLTQYPYKEGGNVLAEQGSALAYAGTLYPEFKNSKKWAETGFGYIGNQFLEDGMHIELDLSYHIGIVDLCYKVIKLIDANNLGDKLAPGLKESLERAANVVVQFTFPNYFDGPDFGNESYERKNFFVPGFNDTRQVSWKRSVLNKNFIKYTELFPDNEEFKYMKAYGKNNIGNCPDTEAKIFKNSGYYVLRNGWNKASTMMILSNNNSGSVAIQPYSHNQPDNGTFELYYNGRNFFPDSGVRDYYTYSGSDKETINARRTEFRKSSMHNTLTLDGENFIKTEGKYLSSDKVGENTEVIVFENPGYPNLTHRRYVFFVEKKFFVIVDEGIGEGTKDKAVSIHFNLCEGENNEVIIDKDEKGAHTSFSDGSNILIRTLQTNDDANTTLTQTTGKVSYNTIAEFTFDRPAYSIDMAAGERDAARFLTVIYPTNSADGVNITGSMKQEYDPNGVSDIQIHIGSENYNLSYRLNN